MTYITEKEKALQNKIIAQTKQPDFEKFWEKQVSYLRSFPIKYTKTKIKTLII